MNKYDYVVLVFTITKGSRTSTEPVFWTGKDFTPEVQKAKTYESWRNANAACQALNRSRTDKRFFYAQFQEVNER